MQTLCAINYNKLCGVAIVRLNISSSDFDELSPIEFRYAMMVANSRDESLYKTRYEVARFIVKHIWNSAGKSIKEYLHKGQDVEKFIWELDVDEVGQPQQSMDEMKRQLYRIANSHKKR